MMKRSNLFFYITIGLVAVAKNVQSKLSREILDSRKEYAARMLSYMNQSVYPCNDFYEYACGNWKNVNGDRMSLTRRINVLDNEYKLDDIAENILQRSHINDVAPEYAAEFQKAKKFYYNCLEAKLYPMRASPEYLGVLNEIGGFPAMDADWNSENFHWLNMSAHLSNYDVKSFINDRVIADYPYVPYFSIPKFGFDIELHDDTIQNSSSNAYIENAKRMRDILTIYGVGSNHIDRIVTEIFDFLKKTLSVLKEFNEDPDQCEILSKSMKNSDVAAVLDKWHAYYDIAWSGKIPIYFLKYDAIKPCWFLYNKIDKICEENKQAAANYLSLKFLFHMDARLKDKKYQKDFCNKNVRTSMLYFFDHLYMKLYFSDDIREEVSDISKEIRQSFRTILQNADWLDETTRRAALRKESKIVEHIGRYEDPAVAKLLIGELKKLKFVTGSFAANYLNLRKFKQYMVRFSGLNIEKLSRNTKPLLAMVGMQSNCFYYNTDNSIYVMAGFLTGPCYNRTWPNSLKYGTLGADIGHEYTHGFDVDGAKYNDNGAPINWWSNKSAKAFEERAQCYVDHYQKYFIPEINRYINGDLTKNENIADGGGLHEALMAYRRYLKDLTEKFDSTSALYKEEQMPGIDLSPEQLFFLGFAQLWCASYKEAHYWEELTDVHTIDKYRVLGALSNNDDFSKAFNCPVGSNMNPSANKCNLW